MIIKLLEGNGNFNFKIADNDNLNIPFEDVGISPTYDVIKDNRYDTEWHYFGDCISTVEGCYPDIDEEEYWEYFGPEGDESDAPYWDATQMAQALYQASIYLGDKELINAPPSALQDNVICGVIDEYNIGFIYNIDEDVHYFFEID